MDVPSDTTFLSAQVLALVAFPMTFPMKYLAGNAGLVALGSFCEMVLAKLVTFIPGRYVGSPAKLPKAEPDS